MEDYCRNGMLGKRSAMILLPSGAGSRDHLYYLCSYIYNLVSDVIKIHSKLEISTMQNSVQKKNIF